MMNEMIHNIIDGQMELEETQLEKIIGGRRRVQPYETGFPIRPQNDDQEKGGGATGSW